MRPVLSILLVVCLIVSCGQDPNAPVYDTKTNPNNFPQLALDLIDDIEAGQLDQFDQIVTRFADLYTDQSSLLDNQDWKEVIDRLGSKFQYRAQIALEHGLKKYTETATNYMLASFAHPDDEELDRMSRLFSTWTNQVRKDTTGLYTKLDEIKLSERIDILRQFELADSLSRVFSDEFLRGEILGPQGAGGVNDDQLEQLSEVDRALLDYADLIPYEVENIVASWGEPPLKLVAAQVKMTRPGWYLVEMYFMATRKIDKDYTLSLQAVTYDTLPSISKGELDYIPFDFSPVTPTSQWVPGKIIATAKPIYFDKTLKQLRIGLYQQNVNNSQLRLADKDEAMYILEINSETK